MQDFRALTVTGSGPLRVLVSDCHASAAFDARRQAGTPPAYHPFKAIWDTGATASVITQAVIDACSLKPTGMVRVHGVHGAELAETFLANVGLPNGVAFPSVPVTRGKLAGADILIGMDIITTGDFAITNVGRKTVFSFRIPSIETIDYVREAAQLSKAGNKGNPFYRALLSKKGHRR